VLFHSVVVWTGAPAADTGAASSNASAAIASRYFIVHLLVEDLIRSKDDLDPY
jgi:hypothetical protein